jgi:hypothetical protein
MFALGRYGRANAILVLVLAAAWATAASGCGYEFEAEGPALPASAQTIYVGQFANMSRTTGIAEPFMRYVKDEIANHDRLTLVDSPTDADLVLTGTINNVQTQPGSLNSVDEPTNSIRQLSVSAQLTDGHSGKVIWSENGISSTQRFADVASALLPSSPVFLQQNFRARDIGQLTDIQVAQTQQTTASHEVMSNVAHELYVLMSEGF